MSKQIKEEKFYTPNEVVELGIMKANTIDTKKQMLLRFIRQGRIEAKNVGGNRKPRYLIQGKDLIEYKNRQIKRGDYITK